MTQTVPAFTAISVIIRKRYESSKKYPVHHSKNVTLKPEQQKKFINTILTKGTTEYSLYKALWSRDIVAAAIQRTWRYYASSCCQQEAQENWYDF